jgi:hypothetical protein
MDRYSKFILIIIAIALSVIALESLSRGLLVSSAEATSAAPIPRMQICNQQQPGDFDWQCAVVDHGRLVVKTN